MRHTTDTQPNQTPVPDPPALVMIVEDETPIAEALTLIIEDAGYHVLVAAHGRMAMEQIIAGARPLLIITDLMMPQLDGVGLIDAVRSTLGAEAPPIVIMTAGDRTYASQAHADAILSKPFTLRQIEALLDHYLQRPPSPE